MCTAFHAIVSLLFIFLLNYLYCRTHTSRKSGTIRLLELENGLIAVFFFFLCCTKILIIKKIGLFKKGEIHEKTIPLSGCARCKILNIVEHFNNLLKFLLDKDAAEITLLPQKLF